MADVGIRRKWLLSESSQGVASVSPSIISIVGKGGTRKTTLARLAYRDNRLNIHFDKKKNGRTC